MPTAYNAECFQSSFQMVLHSAGYQSTPLSNEFYRAYSLAQQSLVLPRPVKSIFQLSLQASIDNSCLSNGRGSQASSIAFSPNSSEGDELDSLLGPGLGPSESQFALAGNLGITQGTGMSCILCGLTQFEQNYPLPLYSQVC